VVFLGKEERKNVVGFNNKVYVIKVAEMSAPIQRLSKKLDQLIIYVNRVCYFVMFFKIFFDIV
jgi:hypothetical protein